MILPKFTIIFLALFGALLLGMIYHESIHLVQAKEPYSICYDLGQKSILRVNGDFDNSLNLELPAYIISILVTLVLFICIIADFKFKG